jgi:hypothetical protein
MCVNIENGCQLPGDTVPDSNERVLAIHRIRKSGFKHKITEQVLGQSLAGIVQRAR